MIPDNQAIMAGPAKEAQSNVRILCFHDTDPDFRRTPKTKVYCPRCQRDLKPGEARRYIHMVQYPDKDFENQLEDGILHPLDRSKWIPTKGDMGIMPVGMYCAKKIGLEWTFDESREEAKQT